VTTDPGSQTGAEDVTQPVPRVRPRRWLRPNWIVALVLVWAGLAVYDFHARLPGITSAVSPVRPQPSPARQPGGRTAMAAPTPTRTRPGAVLGRRLTPVSVTSFGVGGAGQGDNGAQASLAIDGNPATAWRSDWYATARFGNLYSGSGLLLNMGRMVTITALRLRLGPADGATFQVRIGDLPALAGLPSVADVADAGRVVSLRLAAPPRGRYVLIWFTSLPPDQVGTFQVSVYNVSLRGWPVRPSASASTHVPPAASTSG
jgi:hypothetical protein